jgi:hypothetical protein
VARGKIKLQDTIARVVFIETDATIGATLGTNLFLPDGSVATPATLAEWMGVSTSTGTLAHRLLAGLRLGNDHPQYPLKAATETISGQWDFTQQIRGASGSAAAPLIAPTTDTNSGLYGVGADNIGVSTNGVLRWDVNAARVAQVVPLHINIDTSPGSEVSAFQINDSYTGAGVEITVFSTITPTPPANDGGVQIGVWEGSGRPPGGAASGYRWRMLGDVDSAADMVFYSHSASASGTEIYRHERDRAQMFFANGTAALPTISFASSHSSGLYWNASTTSVDASISGTAQLGLSATRLRVVPPIYLSDGSVSAPSLAFNSQTNDGIYTSGTNIVNFVTNGVTRLDIRTTQLTATVPIRGANGTAAAPTYSFSGDVDNGMYLTATANTVGFSTAGTVRFQIGASGQWGIGGATYGTAGQCLLSGGASAAPTWGSPTLVAANFANPTASIGLTAVTGSALTAMRSDAAPALDQGIAPTWTAQHLFAITGGVSAPDISFATDPNSGFYRIGADNIGASVGGVKVLDLAVASTQVVFTDGLYLTQTSAFNGARLYFQGRSGGVNRFRYSTDAGATSSNFRLYDESAAADRLGIATNGQIESFGDGAVGSPNWTWNADPDTGRYRAGANSVRDVAGGVASTGFDDNSTAGNTRFLIYDVDNGTLERVSVGAADSGGAGFKLLRIPN